MKNYVQSGDTLELPAPYAVVSGGGARIGGIFGVAQMTAAINVIVAFATRGVFDHAKPGSQAWAVGASIYWDDAAKNVTTVVGANKLVGYAVLAVGAGAGETVGRVFVPGL